VYVFDIMVKVRKFDKFWFVKIHAAKTLVKSRRSDSFIKTARFLIKDARKINRKPQGSCLNSERNRDFCEEILCDGTGCI